MKVVDVTVMPGPKDEARTPVPLMKPDPVMTMFWLLEPWTRELGFVDSTVGAVTIFNE